MATRRRNAARTIGMKFTRMEHPTFCPRRTAFRASLAEKPNELALRRKPTTIPPRLLSEGYRFALVGSALRGGDDAPHGVADIVRHQQRPGTVDRDADGAALRISVLVEETGEDV